MEQRVSGRRSKNRQPYRLLVVCAILTLLYLVGIALNLTPWLRGPEEWRWAYAIPGTLVRLWFPAALLSLYLLLAIRLRRGPATRRQLGAVLVAGMVMTPTLQLALLTMDHPDVRAPLFYRTVSELSGGFFNVGAVVTDNRDFLINFPERMASYPVHPQRHPPGLPLLFAWARQTFERAPDLSREIAARLRVYQCNNLALMKLPDPAIASATLQMAVPALLGLVVLPLYQFGRRVYNRATAVDAVLFWPLIPSVALWATRWNHLYALVTLLAFLFFSCGLFRQAWGWLLPSGLVVSVGTLFSLGNVAIVGFLGIWAFFWLYGCEQRPGPSRLLGGAAFFAVGFSLPWLWLWLRYDLGLAAIWYNAMGTHLGLGRSYLTWLLYHLYDLGVFLGIPLTVVWLAQVVTAGRGLRHGRGVDHLSTLAFALGILLLDLSGMSQGEVARVWAFLLPLPLLAAAAMSATRSWLFVGVAGLLSLQLFVSNVFLRPVGTGLTDPSPPPTLKAVRLDFGDALAKWEEGVALLSADAHWDAGSRDGIEVAATWTTAQPISYPYTLFVHLVDSQGAMVSQADGMPQGGGWLTTCWQPGFSFEDRYRLAVPANSEEASYQVRIGFYRLETGERLPLDGDPLGLEPWVVLDVGQAVP